MTRPKPSTDPAYERRGCVEIRWNEDDPDDVVAPWPRSLDGTPILVHIERMDDDHIWLAIYDKASEEDVHMDIYVEKGHLRWSVRDSERGPTPADNRGASSPPATAEPDTPADTGWAKRELDRVEREVQRPISEEETPGAFGPGRVWNPAVFAEPTSLDDEALAGPDTPADSQEDDPLFPEGPEEDSGYGL